MQFSWQDGVAIGIALAAAIYLAWRIWPRQSAVTTGGCISGCNGCATTACASTGGAADHHILEDRAAIIQPKSEIIPLEGLRIKGDTLSE